MPSTAYTGTLRNQTPLKGPIEQLIGVERVNPGGGGGGPVYLYRGTLPGPTYVYSLGAPPGGGAVYIIRIEL
jgi:hypothetical protein